MEAVRTGSADRATAYSYRPAAWSPERDARGAAPDRGPRCTDADCPVRWPSGPDRPCPEHAADAALAALARRARVRADLARIASSPARRAAAAALLRDPRRDSRVTGREAGCCRVTVQRVRAELEAAGLIPVFRARSRTAGPEREAARRELLRGPERPASAVAAAAGCAKSTAQRARSELEAAGQVPAWRGHGGPGRPAAPDAPRDAAGRWTAAPAGLAAATAAALPPAVATAVTPAARSLSAVTPAARCLAAVG
jgi:hypothetical protein